MDNVKGFTNTRKINQEAAQWILLIEDTPKLSKEQVVSLNEWVATSDVHKECLANMANSSSEMGLLASVMVPNEVKSRSNKAIIKAWFFTPLIAVMYLIDRIFAALTKFIRPMIAAPIVLAFVGWLVVSTNQSIVTPINGVLFATEIGQQSQHLMKDGSVIWLNSNSEVTVDYSAQRRRVNLVKGEAHFEVAKDKTRPFEVYADDKLVRAIGTAFSVYKLNGSIEVLVSEGKVELALVGDRLMIQPDDYDAVAIADLQSYTSTTKKKSDHVIDPQHHIKQTTSTKILGQLVAGQRVSIPASPANGIPVKIDEIVEVDSSELTRKLSWRKGKLIFAGETLAEVVREITRHTEIQIDVFDPALKKIRIGGQFQVGETDGLFYVLESGFGISVNRLDKNHVQLHVKESVN